MSWLWLCCLSRSSFPPYGNLAGRIEEHHRSIQRLRRGSDPMVDTLSPQSAAPHARGLGRQIFGVLTSPRATYSDVATHPRWLGALVVVLATSILSSTWLLSTDVGQRAVIDQQLQTAE